MSKILAVFILSVIVVSCSPNHNGSNGMSHEHTNALVDETSPYLLQHAHNPVDWYPWSEEAFEKASKEGKLVLVSVGYSACHWCHVMERETFEDSTAAAFMNEHFVNIKVDREERPDVDQVYMNAVQLMAQRGGWPLNCFTLPDGRPIYGGTYFPKDDWLNVLQSLVDIQQNEPEKMEEYAQQLTSGVQQSELVERNTSESAFDRAEIDGIVESWKKGWDLNEGGPSRAPKFPLPNNYEFLLHYATETNDDSVKQFVRLTLDKMAQGGIYDQVGGGFARYSVDGIWKVPHFEKMLYDNAQLVSLYSKAGAAFSDRHCERIVNQTLEFIHREMTSDEGLFYSALDADSEGEEGKFYVWTTNELETTLGSDFELASRYYQLDRGKWEHDNIILLRSQNPETFAKENDLDLNTWLIQLSSIEEKLLQERSNRVRPGLDDKILCSWNSMMIKGYVDAYSAFGNEVYLQRAEMAMRFLLNRMKRDDGGLLHSYKDGKAKINGYLEDYSFTIEALISLYQATFDAKWLESAKELTDYTFEHFYDQESGMFWFTSDLDPALIARKQEVVDNVIPSSNSSLAKSLFQLGTYFDLPKYRDTSGQMLQNIRLQWDYGQSYSNWAILALWNTETYYEVAICGEQGVDELATDWRSNYLPNTLLLGGELEHLPLLEGKVTAEGTIYVCFNKSCQLPVKEVSDALEQLD